MLSSPPFAKYLRPPGDRSTALNGHQTITLPSFSSP